MVNINDFIAKYVVKRSQSMFLPDINANTEQLKQKIANKSVLVIGGAGSGDRAGASDSGRG